MLDRGERIISHEEMKGWGLPEGKAIDVLSTMGGIKHCIPKVGVGITTHNRYDTFQKTLSEIDKHCPSAFKIVVVDDASTVPVPEATYRYEKNVGIAVAKNKCFELLDDCDHIFLFDDDTYPVTPNWWQPYVQSGEPHLMYIFQDFANGRKLNDNVLLYQDDKLQSWSHPRGVMCYFQRKCLDKVGGMDPIFGRWGWEHPQLSDRIFNSGLTKFRYADVVGSEKLFYSADEHQTVRSTVLGTARTSQIRRNKDIYISKRGSTEYIPYQKKKNIVLTSYFTKHIDPQRAAKWAPDYGDVETLVSTVISRGNEVVILHDEGLAGPVSSQLKYVGVWTHINPYFQRWLSYHEYLVANRRKLEKVFCVDATDVEMLKNPFSHMECGVLYTGDEPGQISCEWMVRHHRSPILSSFFKRSGSKQLVNAGLLGGDVDIVIEFCKAMMDFYFEAESDSFHKKQPNAGMTDMGAFNYIVHTKFADRLQHGQMVNTTFKANERNNTSWWKHK